MLNFEMYFLSLDSEVAITVKEKEFTLKKEMINVKSYQKTVHGWFKLVRLYSDCPIYSALCYMYAKKLSKLIQLFAYDLAVFVPTPLI